MSTYVDKTLSLVERKKLQWAREREELANLNSFWSSDHQSFDAGTSRTRNASKFSTPKHDYLRRDSTSSTPSRRPSLPPLYQTKSYQYNSIDKSDREMGGETSGYGSDNPPENFPPANWNSGGYESSSSSREDRPKWGDKGVHVGKFWEPKDEDFEKSNNDTPGWVKRGLERKTELIVSNMSPAESPEQRNVLEDDRPCTSGSNETQARSYIRGQNAPVDTIELAERERKRQIALAHQEAIRQQLEEREQKRREERERRIREEYEEEERIRREQEKERQRQEREQKLLQEKLERERKRKEAIQEAIELAARQAREEKMKQRMIKQNNEMNNSLNDQNEQKAEKESQILKERNDNLVIIDNHISKDEGTFRSDKVAITPKEEGRLMLEKQKNEREEVNLGRPCEENVDKCPKEEKLNNLSKIPDVEAFSKSSLNDGLALVLQTPMETLQNMQFAVLMPGNGQGKATALPIAVPIALAKEGSGTARTENRILTPTQYRNKRVCDSSTQTDFPELSRSELAEQKEKYIREKLSNLEISRRRLRSEERTREIMEERPKWNANRPPTRYLKQSEKDPLYQRRKRLKQRMNKGYEEKLGYSAHSSDESQGGSPRLYRKRGYIDKRQSRGLWRKDERVFAQNVRVFQTEILPLESDREQIYYKTKSGRDCCCTCRCSSLKHKYADHIKVVDILKIEHGDDRYKTEQIDRLPECGRNPNTIENSGELLEKLNSIRGGLAVKQNNWENTRTPSLCSPENMAKLDDFLGKKKETAPILDLSKARPANKEEFRRLFDKVPDFKVKQEKIRAEDIKIREKNFKFKTGKKDYKNMKEPYTFMDPIPTDMKNLSIKDLAAVPIDWRMLTTVRPKSKVDEEFFTRMVELRKLEMKTEAKDKRDFITDPQIRKFKNKAGVLEQRVIACIDCGEDFCNGAACTQLVYDCFSRIQDLPSKIASKTLSPVGKEDKKKKKKVKKKTRSRSKSKRRSRSKSKSPKKEPSKK